MHKFLVLALAMLGCILASTCAQSEGKYCFQPCKVRLTGKLNIKHIKLDDPKMDFDAYILMLDSTISVPESGPYIAVNEAAQVQLEFLPKEAHQLLGECVAARGELTGAVTASDMGSLVLQVDSIDVCK